jgi:cytochrome oxidase assembly protein ShyY1
MKFAGLRFRPRAWAFALALVGCVGGILLGNWQSGRAIEKRAALAALKHVALNGEFQPGYTVLLDLRMHQGRPGYHVVQPLRVANGKDYVVVLRGWVAAGARREILPSVATPPGDQRVEGIALERVPQYMDTQGPSACRPGAKPCVWQNLRIEHFAAWSGLPVERFVVEQTNPAADGLLREWERPEATFLRNEMYALQWYSLAALCAILFIVLSFRRDPTRPQ